MKLNKFMQKHQNRLQAVIALGDFFRTYQKNTPNDSDFDICIGKAEIENGWFTSEVLSKSIANWGAVLTSENIKKWLLDYSFGNESPKTIALILAGNIPMVGLHDLLCVWISGHDAVVKLASKDQRLLPFIADFLTRQAQESPNTIKFVSGKLSSFDAVIATGSNNAARYFEHYFSHVPNIIRKNRNAVAVLSGNESIAELEDLGDDILQYFGLGCRNVSKLMLPKGFDLNAVFGGLYRQSEIINNAKYANNYDYNKAVFLMSEFDFLENGFFILKEDPAIAAPIACAHYEYYDSLEQCASLLKENEDKIQCVVSHLDLDNTIPFGKAQQPELWDYADQVDTLDFLITLK